MNAPVFKAFISLLLSSICLLFPHIPSPSLCYLTYPFLTSFFLLPEEYQGRLYRMHWITPITDSQSEDEEQWERRLFSASFLSFASLLLPEQPVNKNRQTNEGQQHMAAHEGLRLIDSPGDLSRVRGVLGV